MQWCAGQPPIKSTVTYSPSSTPKLGTFKATYFAQAAPPLPGFPSSGSVVIKQFYIRTADTPGASLPESGQQIIDLSREILCTQWASVLMRLVYDFIRSSKPQYGQPPFPIPQFRFVRVALAIESKESHDRRVFMIEERIDKHDQGPWCKYINNNSAVPLLPPGAPARLQHATEFLVFCQHVQYMKTKGLAYVSDFQGGTTLLSDPQIITSPTLTGVFGDGNIQSSFSKFIDEHVCSKFCKFYCLGPLVAHGARSTGSQAGTPSNTHAEVRA
ncbi:hypothetical protein BV20DRAFT_952422 [Pilatotrama ljubarskyi]|nr:hypothetical protein BV20DRAFT_952422 [Pilatotrama ljubarskyi]